MVHDRALREKAIERFDAGFGYESTAHELGLPVGTVMKWRYTYGALGKGALFVTSHKKYSHELKVAAARDVVERGMTLADAMAKHGIASLTPLKNWCSAYREGGPDALKPKPKGRPPGSGGKHAAKTREQELEERVRYLEAENAYLKKCRALMAGKASRGGRRPGS